MSLAEELQRLISLHSSVLIEHFRKSKKEKSFFYKLTQEDFQGFIVSVIVHHEIHKGAAIEQGPLLDNLVEDFIILPYMLIVDTVSLKIFKELKKNRKSVELEDLIIAATSKSSNVPLATINERHFNAIEGLHLITPSSFTS
jgi:tRNA(fMet)-specific endonuclease VapC